MLSNRGWLLKLLIPLGIFALLCVDAALRIGADLRPQIERCLAEPDRFDGREIWVSLHKVAEHTPEGFWIQSKAGRVFIRTEQHPSTDTWITTRGVFRKPAMVVAEAVSVHKSYVAKRSGVYGISTVVLVAWLFFFLKRFKLGFRGGLFHPHRPEEPTVG